MPSPPPRCVDCRARIHGLEGARPPRRCRPCRAARLSVHGTIRARRVRAAFVAPVDREAIFERDGSVCGVCGLLVDRTLRHPDPMSATVDHIVPLALGGAHGPDNVQTCHLRCNLRKGTHLQSESMEVHTHA